MVIVLFLGACENFEVHTGGTKWDFMTNFLVGSTIQQNQTEIYVINHKKNQPSHPFKTTTPRE